MQKSYSKFNFITKTESNYKKTAFRFFIAYLFSTWGIFFLLIGFDLDSFDPSVLAKISETISIVSKVLLGMGIVFTVLSHKNQEEKNYQYRIAFWGFGISLLLIILPILMRSDLFEGQF